MASRAQARKADLNEATVQELVEVGGLRQAAAEAVVKRRDDAGPFESLEAVADIPGIGKTALDQMRDAFDVSAEATQELMKKTAEQGEAVAEEAQATAKKAVSEAGQSAVEAAKRTQAMATGVALDGMPVAQHLGMVWASYWFEQLQDGFKLTTQMYTCRDVKQLLDLQADFAQITVRRFEDRMRETVDLMVKGGIQAAGHAREQVPARV